VAAVSRTQESADLTKEALKVLPKVLQDPASVLLDICAYAGTGNVLKVQQLLHMCSEHVDKEKEEVFLLHETPARTRPTHPRRRRAM
jgi:hypothetical protein